MINTSNFKPMMIDALAEWLATKGAFQDKEREFLTAEGYNTGDIATDWMKFLIAQGISQTDLATMQKQWFAQVLLANPSSRNKGFSVIPQNVDMTIGTP